MLGDPTLSSRAHEHRPGHMRLPLTQLFCRMACPGLGHRHGHRFRGRGVFHQLEPSGIQRFRGRGVFHQLDPNEMQRKLDLEGRHWRPHQRRLEPDHVEFRQQQQQEVLKQFQTLWFCRAVFNVSKHLPALQLDGSAVSHL